MTKLPSYLKGLVESRARAAGDIERLEQLRALIDEQLTAARKKLDAADLLIRDFSPLLDPTTIAPVRARKGKYGKHGNFKATVTLVLEEANGEALPTPEIAFKVAEKLQLKFDSMQQYRDWAHNAVANELRRKMNRGEVERFSSEKGGGVTRWQLATKVADGAAGGKVEGLEGLKTLAG